MANTQKSPPTGSTSPSGLRLSTAAHSDKWEGQNAFVRTIAVAAGVLAATSAAREKDVPTGTIPKEDAPLDRVQATADGCIPVDNSSALRIPGGTLHARRNRRSLRLRKSGIS